MTGVSENNLEQKITNKAKPHIYMFQGIKPAQMNVTYTIHMQFKIMLYHSYTIGNTITLEYTQ